MGQKNSSNNSDDVLPDGSNGLSKQDAPSIHPNEEEETREKCPVLCPAYKEIVLECYDKSHGDTAARIVMRMGQQREDFRAFMDLLSSDQREMLTENLRNYLNSVVQNIDDADRVKDLSANFGAFHVRWRANGFKPDFFAVTADAIATECVFMGGTATATAPTSTFKAWTMLVGLMFSSVRDGYYAELRRQRRSPAPTSDSVESLPTSDQCTESATYQDGSSRTSIAYGNDDRHNSETRYVCSTPPRLRNANRERSSGSPRSSYDRKHFTDSRHSLTDVRPPAAVLHREEAFYVRRLPQPYHRSKSAIIDNAIKAQSNEPIDYATQEERLRKLAIGSSRETTSTTVSSSGGSNSPIAGRYQKNVTADYDMRRRHRIDETVKGHDMHKYVPL
uniref:Globin family profile domain-containing protein n=1 Tax=Ascaris lumbricoides TaxID=6252 RepID=A0A9J2P2F7_ASCLU